MAMNGSLILLVMGWSSVAIEDLTMRARQESRQRYLADI
jgi:hypothetical protein